MPSLSTPNPYDSALTIVLRRHLERLQILKRQLSDSSTPAAAFLTRALMKAHLLQLRNVLLERRCANVEKRYRELTETTNGGHGRPIYSQQPPQQDAPESKAHDPERTNSILEEQDEITKRDERIAVLGKSLRSANNKLYVYQVTEDLRVRQLLAKEHGEHAKTVEGLRSLLVRAGCESAMKATECAELERWAKELENKLVKMAAEQEFVKETYRIRLQQMEGTIKWMGELAQKRALEGEQMRQEIDMLRMENEAFRKQDILRRENAISKSVTAEEGIPPKEAEDNTNAAHADCHTHLASALAGERQAKATAEQTAQHLQAQIRHARVLQQKHENFRQKMIDLLARMKAEKLAPKTNTTAKMEDPMLDATGQQDNCRQFPVNATVRGAQDDLPHEQRTTYAEHALLSPTAQQARTDSGMLSASPGPSHASLSDDQLRRTGRLIESIMRDQGSPIPSQGFMELARRIPRTLWPEYLGIPAHT